MIRAAARTRKHYVPVVLANYFRGDNFNRSDANSIGTPSAGGTWVETDPNGHFHIESGVAVARGSNGYGFAFADLGTDQQDITVEITGAPGSYWFVDMLVSDPTLNGKLRCQHDNGSSIQLAYEAPNGAETVISSFGSPVPIGTKATWRFVATAGPSSATLSVYVNGTLAGNATYGADMRGHHFFGLLGQTGTAYDNCYPTALLPPPPLLPFFDGFNRAADPVDNGWTDGVGPTDPARTIFDGSAAVNVTGTSGASGSTLIRNIGRKLDYRTVTHFLGPDSYAVAALGSTVDGQNVVYVVVNNNGSYVQVYLGGTQYLAPTSFGVSASGSGYLSIVVSDSGLLSVSMDNTIIGTYQLDATTLAAMGTYVGFATYHQRIDEVSYFSKLYPADVPASGGVGVLVDTRSVNHRITFRQPTSNGQGGQNWSLFQTSQFATGNDHALRYQKGATGNEADYFIYENNGQNVLGSQSASFGSDLWVVESLNGTWQVRKNGAPVFTTAIPALLANNTHVQIATAAGVVLSDVLVEAL